MLERRRGLENPAHGHHQHGQQESHQRVLCEPPQHALVPRAKLAIELTLVAFTTSAAIAFFFKLVEKTTEMFDLLRRKPLTLNESLHKRRGRAFAKLVSQVA